MGIKILNDDITPTPAEQRIEPVAKQPSLDFAAKPAPGAAVAATDDGAKKMFGGKLRNTQAEAEKQPAPEAAPSPAAKSPFGNLSTSTSTPGASSGVPPKFKAAAVAVAALMIGTVVLWPKSKPAQAPAPAPAVSAAPAAATTAVPAPAAIPAATAAPALETLMKTDLTDEQRAINRQESMAVYQKWPSDKQRCSELASVRTEYGTTNWYTGLCGEVGAEKYFKCSPTGLIWDMTIPGCDPVAK